MFPNLSRQSALLSLKLLHDSLALSLAFLSGMILIEALLPGFVSNYLGFIIVIPAIALQLGAIAILGKATGISIRQEGSASLLRKKITWLFLISGLALVANSLFRFSWWEIIISTAAAAVICLSLYRSLFGED